MSEGRDLMTYVSDNYTSYGAPSPLRYTDARVPNVAEIEVELKNRLKVMRTVVIVTSEATAWNQYLEITGIQHGVEGVA